MAEKVVVGMSGGVDSSVAAYLLKLQGYEVSGVTMQVWNPDEALLEERDDSCCGLTAVDDARRVCLRLGMGYHVLNFRDVFEEKVIGNFIDEYIHGRTPNPCIVCNRYAKWESMLSRADSIGAYYVATGHYARIKKLPNGRFSVQNAQSAKKDQTYALCFLKQEQLARTLMPLGDYEKEEVRRIAADAGLPVAGKPDSEDICFVKDKDYAGFLNEAAPGRIPPPGRFVDESGRDLGAHKGITHYTIGQRKGLGLAMGEPVFVNRIDPTTNEVVVGNAKSVLCGHLVCRGLNFMAISHKELPVGAKKEGLTGRIRYGGAGTPCEILRTGEDEITAYFKTSVRAVTPGQAAVFYEDDYIYLAGTIAGA